MATGFSATPRKEGTWTKLVIFIALYVLILESILQWVLVLYLYGNAQVDHKITLSVVLSLVASFLSVPLVTLQSLVAWQYNKIGGFGTQKTVLHNACTYVLRLDLMAWLATSVAGLVVAAQQVYCLPVGSDGGFWRVGVSCAFHRSSVIVSVVSLVTVCTLYCARELCDRPYDVSLLGIYRRQFISNGSILSGHSWDSDETLKSEILTLCRQHDGKSGGDSWSIDPLADKVKCHPSIRHPAPVRVRPLLRVNTGRESEHGEITSGMTWSPEDTVPRASPGGQSTASEFHPISRTSTVMTSQTACESRGLVSGWSIPKVPAIPEHFSNHKRQKSSLSSLRRFLPKSFPLSLPLSADPQIRALADPNTASDVEKQVVTPTNPLKAHPPTTEQSSQTEGPGPIDQKSQSTTVLPDEHGRTMTMNSADAPEVVPDQSPKVRRSQTACLAPHPRSIHHPHHPNYVPVPAPANPRTYSSSCRQLSGLAQMNHHENMRRSSSRPTNIVQYPVPVRSATYQFDSSHIPRYTQSQYHPHYIPQPTRGSSQRRFDPSRTISVVPRRNDVEIIYPSTRRSRSSTYGAVGGHLSCILESTSDPRASVDETQRVSAALSEAPSNVIDPTTYRGTNRTSIGFY
ncbi:hypothetical protein NUU61_002053 [Penicillium alfredii]|uniref:Uncharacterized protein n=1 Tax=Penicillium alfredii TaxID=1506179 RepID=A0A9W9FQS0_9EURO|nr:uncharacterized protein NUU61_002053 [Penicillium alfredii]KAJ5104706.1 hypothetical protein NUU61_002053 [Penicillium alfredii]